MAGFRFVFTTAPVPLTAGQENFLCYIKSAANIRTKIESIRVTFDGHNYVDPKGILVVARPSGSVGGGASLTAVKVNSLDGETVNTTALGGSTPITALTATDYIERDYVAPTGSFAYNYSELRPLPLPGGVELIVTYTPSTLTSAVNARVEVKCEEGGLLYHATGPDFNQALLAANTLAVPYKLIGAANRRIQIRRMFVKYAAEWTSTTSPATPGLLRIGTGQSGGTPTWAGTSLLVANKVTTDTETQALTSIKPYDAVIGNAPTALTGVKCTLPVPAAIGGVFTCPADDQWASCDGEALYIGFTPGSGTMLKFAVAFDLED